jgi:hypothetical protein
MRRLAVCRLIALAVVLTAACTPHPVGPARTYEDYERKARSTAEAALSAVETTRLAATTGGVGHGFGPYLSVLISEQEEGLNGVQGTFGSIQPPDRRSDDLRRRLDRILVDALDHVTDVRIAVRRGDLEALPEVARPLQGDVDALDRFLREHG